MAFCTVCGKELAEGQTCDCQQAATQEGAAQAEFTYSAPQEQVQEPKESGAAGNMFKGILNHVVNTIKKPFEAAEEWMEKGSFVGSTVIIGIITFLYMMAGLLNIVGARIAIKADYKDAYISDGGFLIGRFSEFWKGIKDGIYSAAGLDGAAFAKGTLFPLIYMIAMTGVIIGLAYAINAIFIKGKVDIKKVFTFAGAVSVPVAAACAITMITNIINIGIGEDIINIIVTLLGFVTLLQGLSLISKIITDRKKCLLALLMGVAVLSIANVILWEILEFRYFFTLPM